MMTRAARKDFNEDSLSERVLYRTDKPARKILEEHIESGGGFDTEARDAWNRSELNVLLVSAYMDGLRTFKSVPDSLTESDPAQDQKRGADMVAAGHQEAGEVLSIYLAHSGPLPDQPDETFYRMITDHAGEAGVAAVVHHYKSLGDEVAPGRTVPTPPDR